jgi:formiminoglutamase
LADDGCQVYVTLDADACCTADVPGVSAPNPTGLRGREVIACARRAGASNRVSSLDLVEINPRFDLDGQSARWAALVIWHFLVGHAGRVRSAADSLLS